MATSVRRKAKVDPVETFAQHILLKAQGAVITTRADALKDRLKKAFSEFPGIYANENGSLFFDFPRTISDGKKNYKGMEHRRSVTTVFNEEKAERRLKAKGVYEEALTPVLDQEKVYRLLAEGKITEKDVEYMLDKGERWSFYPVEGEVLD